VYEYFRSEELRCMVIIIIIVKYLGAAKCIISTAQQARPNVMGHRDP